MRKCRTWVLLLALWLPVVTTVATFHTHAASGHEPTRSTECPACQLAKSPAETESAPEPADRPEVATGATRAVEPLPRFTLSRLLGPRGPPTLLDA